MRVRLIYFGAESRARTGDPFLFREMLYQLSYLGEVLTESAERNFCTRGAVGSLLTDRPEQTKVRKLILSD